MNDRQPDAPASGGTPGHQSGGRILIADDNAECLRSLRRFLERCGHDCREATDAAQVMSIVRAGGVELLITDLKMPGNPGLELVQDLSREAPDLPIILMTGHPTMESAARCVGLRVQAYIVKPPDLGQLQETINRLIAAHRHHQTVSRRIRQIAKDLNDFSDGSSDQGKAPQAPTDALFEERIRLAASSLDDLLNDLDLHARPEIGLPETSSELRAAVRETVKVLESTKRSFRSRELGQLRKKLELVLASAGVPAPAPAPITARPQPPDAGQVPVRPPHSSSSLPGHHR